MYPRIERIEDFLTFDYSSIFRADNQVDRFFGLFADWKVPVISVILYLALSTPVFSFIQKAFNLQPKGALLQNFTILHSAILAVYSGWTFYHSTKIVLAYSAQHTFYGAVCDVNGDLWNKHGLAFWMIHFYISKYYEFIDTWIVLLKGRIPMFLQTYHHAGIVVLMWGFVVTSNTSGLIILCFNSFIHTLMYSYYVLAAFGVQSPLKHYLTQAQIGQFIIGIICTLPAHFIAGCQNQAQSFVLAAVQLYAVVLIYLFWSFYVSTYKKKDKAGGSGKKSE